LIFLNNLWKNCKVFASVGYHPSEICFKYKDWSEDGFRRLSEDRFRKWAEDSIKDLKEMFLKHKDVIVWIGECWIDTHYPNWKETLKLQKEFFAFQCELAQELDLPVIIHSRDDFESTMDVVKNFKNLKIYFHCWWYWPDEVEKVLSTFEKVWIWFAWNVTYPKANNLRESLKKLPLEKFVLETDAPYLTPQKKRWQTNYPSNVKLIYEFVSEFKNIEFSKLCYNMKQNFYNLYLS